MDKPNAKVIAHSQAPNGEELITLEIELHRFILPELNTHRVFSRNYSSSRAVPVQKMIDQVRSNPAMPVHWGKNQSGMQAEEELTGENLYNAKEVWRSSATLAANQAEVMLSQNVHKQIVNRLLEPFMWTKGVVTATKDGFDSFFKLRCHKDAQPEIKLLAERMQEAIEQSSSVKMEYGEYHLPYVKMMYPDTGQTSYNDESVEDCIKISASCCAQVSYRNLDTSLDKARKIYDMLNLPVDGNYSDEPPHFSPAEHIAKVMDEKGWCDFTAGGNFVTQTFWQYRKALESGKEIDFIS